MSQPITSQNSCMPGFLFLPESMYLTPRTVLWDNDRKYGEGGIEREGGGGGRERERGERERGKESREREREKE